MEIVARRDHSGSSSHYYECHFFPHNLDVHALQLTKYSRYVFIKRQSRAYAIIL